MKTIGYSLLLITLTGCYSSTVNFPGPRTISSDPSHRFTIQYKKAAETTQHMLYLHANGSTNYTAILGFDRNVAVLWSPCGNHLAITDWEGSNCAEVWIVKDPQQPHQTLNITDLVPERIKKDAVLNHLYYEAQKWKSEDELDFRIWGYGWKNDGTGEYNVALRLNLQTMTVKER